MAVVPASSRGGSGLPTGWTQDAANPANVDAHGGALNDVAGVDVIANGQVNADKMTTITGGAAGKGDWQLSTTAIAAIFGASQDDTSTRYALQLTDHDYADILRVRGDRAVLIVDASGNVLFQVAGDGSIDINGTTGKLIRLRDSLGQTFVQIQDNILALLNGVVVYQGIQTHVITSGALPTVAPVSATAFQVNANYDTYLLVPVTYNPGVATTATCKVELSPDNVTFSTLVTKTVPVGTVFDGQIDPVTIRVPGGWYVKLTVTNATLGTGTYYF